MYRAIAITQKDKKVCNKSISESKVAIDRLYEIEHVEILEYLFNGFIGGKESMFFLLGSVINSEKFKCYDKDNFDDFLEMVKNEKEKALEKSKKQQEMANAIKLAKEQGKKVEMVYENGEMKPVIVDDKKETTNENC